MVRKFRSFEEADAADVADYARMTPQERLQIFFALHRHYHADKYPPNAPEPRLERVLRITKLEQG